MFDIDRGQLLRCGHVLRLLAEALLRRAPLSDEVPPVLPAAFPTAEQRWIGGRAEGRPAAAQDHVRPSPDRKLDHLAGNVVGVVIVGRHLRIALPTPVAS